MDKNTVMVSSITYAIKGRDILRSKGFKAYIEKTPAGVSKHGCGYSIIIPERYDEALTILRQSNIKITD